MILRSHLPHPQRYVYGVCSISVVCIVIQDPEPAEKESEESDLGEDESVIVLRF